MTINFMLTADEDYTDSNMRVLIGAGGPAVSLIFNDTGGAIPGANLAGSIWDGGSAGIGGSPDGTTSTSTGLRPTASFLTTAVTPQQTDGIYATLTFDLTPGFSPGIYSISLTAHPDGPTDVFNGLDEDFEPIPVSELVLVNGAFYVPEPSSFVIGLFAVAGLAAVAVRRHRGRKAA
jgi:hypothetical protein